MEQSKKLEYLLIPVMGTARIPLLEVFMLVDLKIMLYK
ncbi:hypothetical protein TMUPMC115_0186 [Tetragenococcus muriaticus PMC-11-5]|uniref:Uncharacterized protein n=2 Tax=Tetragenococcus muriaticus TaxID=64642 RepID=A0A091C9M4_9ENTE|nr:hypothetical protein TMU3MR103_0184 [Tetragenococcus muriaticus 3MR10-3]KFN93589.1 hypothetical protein TMUPMC115_0186 [Tetragenococcus muriaticus PMC-11-5]